MDNKMPINDVLKRIFAYGVVPVVRVDRPEDALPLAKALCEGGLPCAEITLRTPHALRAIEDIRREYPHMLVGAGTVLNAGQLGEALGAGARFIVSPGLVPELVQRCTAAGATILPGVANATGCMQAVELGLPVVKFFPAETSGGLAGIRALAAPFGGLRFMPTGGVGPHNLAAYLRCNAVLACGGGWMVDPALVAAGDFAAVTQLCREAVALAHGFTLHHVGLDPYGDAAAEQTAELFARLLGRAPRPGPNGIFVGQGVEVMRKKAGGTHGHLAFGVHSVARARAWLETQGFAFDEASVKTDSEGRPTFVYLAGEFGGFTIHLVPNEG